MPNSDSDSDEDSSSDDSPLTAVPRRSKFDDEEDDSDVHTLMTIFVKAHTYSIIDRSSIHGMPPKTLRSNVRKSRKQQRPRPRQTPKRLPIKSQKLKE